MDKDNRFIEHTASIAFSIRILNFVSLMQIFKLYITSFIVTLSKYTLFYWQISV